MRVPTCDSTCRPERSVMYGPISAKSVPRSCTVLSGVLVGTLGVLWGTLGYLEYLQRERLGDIGHSEYLPALRVLGEYSWTFAWYRPPLPAREAGVADDGLVVL